MSMFVVIEGLDGVGKSTITKGLADRLSGCALSTPSEALQHCRQDVLDSYAGDELAKALFYAASVSTQGRKARELTSKGIWVFMDRYWASTVSYAQARGVTVDLSGLSDAIVKPDLTVLLTLDEPERQRRLGQRGASVEDVQTFTGDFRQHIVQYLTADADLMFDTSGLTVPEIVESLTKAILRIHRIRPSACSHSFMADQWP